MSAELSHSFVQQGFSSAAKEQEVPTPASLNSALFSVTATQQARLLQLHLERKDAWPCAAPHFPFVLLFSFRQ
jgi:hypothetical protein